MSYSGLNPTQLAVVQRLRASAAIASRVTGILDAVPEGQAFPYIAFVDPSEVPNRYFGQNGHLVVFSLEIVTQDGSRTPEGRGSAGNREGGEIVELVVNELTDLSNPILVEGHDVVDVDIESVVVSVDDDGTTRRHQLTFTAELEDELL
jgi:hypothetical protein